MLRLANLTKRYASFTLGPIDMHIGREVFALLGPSGCGKTTLLSLIAGTEAPDDGTIRLGENRLDTQPLEQRGTAYVFQESAVFPHLTARENIAYAAARPILVDELAAALEITAVLDQPARTLSGGERRRVEVARALAADPKVLLLDEPTTGLDTPIRRRLRDQLRDLFTDLDIPVLYVTHDQDEASAVADRIAVMHDGAIHQIASPAELFQHPATPFVASFTGNTNVFPARLSAEQPHPTLDWNGLRVDPPAADFPADADVWLCIRPEQVNLLANGTDRPATNVFDAQIERRVFEGGVHVLTLRMGRNGQSALLDAKVLPPTYRQLGLDGRTEIGVHLAPDALHLIPRDV